MIKDEIHADLLQTLEMYLGVVLEQFVEIEKKYLNSRRNAASSHPLDNQVDPKSFTRRSSIRNYLRCPNPWHSGHVCAWDSCRTSVNSYPQNCKRPVMFSSNDLAKNLPAQQPGIKIDTSLQGCVVIIMLHILPANSRPDHSSSFGHSSFSCDAR